MFRHLKLVMRFEAKAIYTKQDVFSGSPVQVNINRNKHGLLIVMNHCRSYIRSTLFLHKMSLANSCLRSILRSPKYIPEQILSQTKQLRLNYKLLSINNKEYNQPKRFFKSEIHTDNLYPGSKVSDKFVIAEPPSASDLPSFNGVIPVKEIELTYIKSSAPGGQNVNKLATKVEARFHLDNAKWLNDETKSILRDKWKTQLTKEGYFVVKSERTRSQQLNQVRT